MKVLVSLSGGMDSATLIPYLQLPSMGYEIDGAVGFTYGSKHNKYELEAARKLADHYKIRFDLIDLTGIASHLESNLLKKGGEIPEGHYEAESMSKTVVPGRNMIFLSILSGIAWSRGVENIAIGIHSGDHAIYPDCRPEFTSYMRQAIREGTDKKIHLITPFLQKNKKLILEIGIPIGTPYNLTRTCYKDQPVACGKCGSCQERLAAFAAVKINDPIEYESRTILPKPEMKWIKK